jgi:hypothetical protein
MKKILNIGIFLFVITVSRGAYGQYGDHHRPSPLMDYVPQEVGFYDTSYEELNEKDCRRCHGNNLADRHHATTGVTRDGLCITCHSAASGSTGITIIRDCVTAGCHKTVEDRMANGWHHNTDLSAVGNCTACHDPNLVARVSPVQDFIASPPSIVTPTPFSCDNCHWEQDVSPPESPSRLGHPSTYDHYDRGRFIGEYQYSKPIYGTFDTHHMGFAGRMVRDCFMCHSVNPNEPSWSHSDPELIRYCESCHTPETLHAIEAHVEGTPGWKAVGFHVDGGASGLMDPIEYRTSEARIPAEVAAEPQFSPNEMCVACHGENVLAFLPIPIIAPVVDQIIPNHGICGGLVLLKGANLGPEKRGDYSVELEVTPGEWIDLDVYAWTSTEIQFQIPCWDLAIGNYKIRVRTPAGVSNQVNFTLDSVSVSSLSPSTSVYGTWIRINGTGLGRNQSEMLDGYFGIHRIIDFVSAREVLTAVEHRNWEERGTGLEVRFGPLYKDRKNPSTQMRNFIWDGVEEPLVQDRDQIEEGVYSVYFKTIYFGDDDSSHTYSEGDTIFQVVASNPHYFKFVSRPVITDLEPENIANSGLLSVYGYDFGVYRENGEVRIGTKNQGLSDQRGRGLLLEDVVQWLDTRIVVRVDVPTWAEGGKWSVWVEKEGVKSNPRMIEVKPESVDYGLKVSAQGKGEFSQVSGQTYGEGDVVTLNALPEDGWVFDHWLVDGEVFRTNPLMVTMNQDKDVEAIFVKATDRNQSVDIDRNNDGIDDATQDNVVSLRTCDGRHYITIESAPGTVLKDCMAVEKPLGADTMPSDGDYPYGFFSFVVEDVEIGGETEVVIYLPEDAEPANYYKYGPEPGFPDPHWYEFVYDDVTRTGAKIEGNRITLYFVDGQGGDDDLKANGRIVDDGGPQSKEKESGGGSGGCFISTMSGIW